MQGVSRTKEFQPIVTYDKKRSTLTKLELDTETKLELDDKFASNYIA